jgi:Flp pilus assembly protein TadG
MAFPVSSLCARRRYAKRTQRGAIVLLACFLMIFMLGVIAFALDIGMLMVARTELQRSADAAALAATWDLVADEPADIRASRAYSTAEQFAAENVVRLAPPSIEVNSFDPVESDVVVGTFTDFGNPNAELVAGESNDMNAVRVRIRRNSEINGEIPFSFARIFGLNGRPTEATATAAVILQVAGFRTPESKANLPILPIAMEEQAWIDLEEGNISDDEWYDLGDGTVQRGSDGDGELALFPQRNNSPGNLGTLDIGSASNSTSDLTRQILDGVSEADLAFHGGELKLDAAGELTLQGDTGISAGVKEALHAITGQTRIIPVYRTVNNPGNNAQYTIVKFVGVRIMSVNLTGRDKVVWVQPAHVTTPGVISSDDSSTSRYVSSPVVLVH